MSEFPVPLDSLIAYVKAIHPDGGPLENVADAFTVSAQLDEQSDALIGHFVDQARRSGASWNQIGTAMGVSKQAAQKRFVSGRMSDLSDLLPKGGNAFSRATDRAFRVLVAASKLAAPEPVGAAHVTAALFTEPEGVAAKVFETAGLSAEQVSAALGTGLAAVVPTADKGALRGLALDESGKATLRDSLKWALRFGHNYIGTEHLMLGVLSAGGQVTDALSNLGLTPARGEQLITAEIAAILDRRKAR
jgi:ATP-dependent Clp protease ATP-binding subunit ClpA